jgi:hypothetical protein
VAAPQQTTPVGGTTVGVLVGPMTPSGTTSPVGCCGIGSNETQPAAPRYTWGVTAAGLLPASQSAGAVVIWTCPK